jgi:purine-binding chemotaxis protein CheW
MSGSNGQQHILAPFLVCRTAGRLCALPLHHIIETMRPLPTRPLADGPSFQLGISTVRGEVLPVVHLGHLVTGETGALSTRFVSVRLDERRAVLAVDAVSGVRALPVDALSHAPTLLDQIDPTRIESIARFDDALISLLRAMAIVSDELLALVEGEARLS